MLGTTRSTVCTGNCRRRWHRLALRKGEGRVRDSFKGGTSNPSPKFSPLRTGRGETGRYPDSVYGTLADKRDSLAARRNLSLRISYAAYAVLGVKLPAAGP